MIDVYKHYLVSFTENGRAFVSDLHDVEISQCPDRFVLTETPIFKVEVRGELGPTRLIKIDANYKDITDEEIINLIKE